MLLSTAKRATRSFSNMPSQIDSAVASVLNIDPSNASLAGTGGGGCSSASASKIKAAMPDGSEKQFFIKMGPNDAMFAGEHASLRALHDAVPTICPQSYGHGFLADGSGKSFLVTDFLEITSGRRGKAAGDSLARKLAKLHTTPAPVPPGYDKPMFGFPAPTCCGDTQQPNSYNASWADFYAENRLRFIERSSRKSNGKDEELTSLVDRLCNEVVPRLIGDDHLNGGKGVQPVVVHGDLWSGNASVGKLPGMSVAEEVTYDSSACYAHSEYELGDMKMFGGFGGDFLKEYHSICPKTEPVEEYDDRVMLYELYHHLNHHAMFGGHYRYGAVSMIKTLLKKYGGQAKEEL